MEIEDASNQALRATDPRDVIVGTLAPHRYTMSVGDVAEFLRQSDQTVAGCLRSGAPMGE